MPINVSLRELDVMQKAGIGGVEINPIKFPSEADPMQTKALTWMSDEWIDVLKAALRGTKERGIREPLGFRTASTPEATRSATEEDIPDSNRLAIRGPWTVRLASVDGSNLSVELPELIDLRKRGHLGAFAGVITYQTNLEINETRLPRWLSLGGVHAISELEINGETLGVRW